MPQRTLVNVSIATEGLVGRQPANTRYPDNCAGNSAVLTRISCSNVLFHLQTNPLSELLLRNMKAPSRIPEAIIEILLGFVQYITLNITTAARSIKLILPDTDWWNTVCLCVYNYPVAKLKQFNQHS
jgi:hypothetical protein